MLDQRNRLYDELRLALARTEPADLRNWGQASALRLPKILVRRIRNFGTLASRIGNAAAGAFSATYSAARQGNLGKYIGDRTAAAIDATIDTADQATNFVASVSRVSARV